MSEFAKNNPNAQSLPSNFVSMEIKAALIADTTQHALNLTLEPGEAFRHGYFHVIEKFTSSGSATLNFGTDGVSGTSDPDDLLDDSAVAGLTAGATIALVPVGTASTLVKNTGTTAKTVKVLSNTAGMTAGRGNLILEKIKLS